MSSEVQDSDSEKHTPSKQYFVIGFYGVEYIEETLKVARSLAYVDVLRICNRFFRTSQGKTARKELGDEIYRVNDSIIRLTVSQDKENDLLE